MQNTRLRAKQASVLNGTGKEQRFICRLKAFNRGGDYGFGITEI
jgi:hypothetical protein